MKRLFSASSIALGLALIVSSVVGCAAHAPGTRTNHVAEAAFIAASVAICAGLSDAPDHPGALEASRVVETVPEELLVDNARYDAETHDVIREVSHETFEGPVFGPRLEP